jgi:hypothetical protein
MIRVYVAGKYNDNNIISVLENMRLGIRACTELILKGYAPFCPWVDFHYSLMLREGELLGKEIYHAHSLKWLEVSDCVLALPNYRNSDGALNEIKRAEYLGIPVYYSVEELLKESKE